MLRSGRLSLGPMLERFETGVRRPPGRRGRRRGLLGHGGASPRRATPGLGRGRRGRHVAAQLRRLGQLPALRGREAGLLRRRPGDARPRSRRRPRRRWASARRGSCPCTSSATRRPLAELERSPSRAASASSRTPARRSARSTPTGRTVGARGNLACFGFYANKQITTGEGGVIVPADADERRGASQRAQPGPRAGHGLARPRPARLQLPAERRCRPRSGSRSSSGASELLGARARVAAALPRAPRRARRGAGGRGRATPTGSCSRARTAAPERRSWFVYVVQLPAGADRDAVIAELDQRGVASKAYLPCIHLMPFYRERFGFRGGEFPVAEEVAARSLALPFFGAMERGRRRSGRRGADRGAARRLDLRPAARPRPILARP